MIVSIIICLSAFLLAFTLVVKTIPQIILVTAKKRLFDVPGGRKAHALPTPTAGGIAIFMGMFISLFTFSFGQGLEQFHPLIISLVVLFFLGLKDDLIGAKASRKLLIQMVLAAVLVFGGFNLDAFWRLLGMEELPMVLKYGASIILVVFLTNAYNMIDGIDGLAGSIGMIASVVFGSIFLLRGENSFALFAFGTAGSLLGFLKFNFQPARIFMGDTGSLVIGFVLSAFMLQVLEGSAIPGAALASTAPLLVLGALAVPVIDMIQVVGSRLAAGQHPFSADRRHLHHKLLALGLTHRNTTLALIGVTCLFIGTSFLFQNQDILINLFNLASLMTLSMISLLFWSDMSPLSRKETA